MMRKKSILLFLSAMSLFEASSVVLPRYWLVLAIKSKSCEYLLIFILFLLPYIICFIKFNSISDLLIIYLLHLLFVNYPPHQYNNNLNVS